MKRIFFFAAMSIIYNKATAQPSYPETRRDEVYDEYFGVKVHDPYRWLEDENSPETKAWVQAQNEVTFGYLNQLTYRDKIRHRLSELWNYEKRSLPSRKGEYYFQYRNSGTQNQSVLYIQKGLQGEATVFLDPNSFSEDGTSSLTVFSVSHDNRYAVYGVSKAGSDWNDFFVVEIPTGNRLKDELTDIKFSGAAWYGNGFFYSRFEKPAEGKVLSDRNKAGRLFYHALGTPQSADKLIYEDPAHPDRMFGASVTEDQQYLIVSISESTSGEKILFRKLGVDNAPWVTLNDTFEHDFSLLDHVNGRFIILTNHEAPNYRLISVDPLNPRKENWKTLIPESDRVLQSASLMKERLIANYLQDVQSVLEVYDYSGKLTGRLALPGPGIVSGISSKKTDADAFISFGSFTEPGLILRYNAVSGKMDTFWKAKTSFATEMYVTEQVFYNSKDGTRIPMFIVRKRGTELTPSTPCFLYGYGGFNISVTPSFSPSMGLFLEQGGVYAVANIRGGGEYGTSWHKAGTKLKKQNVFDDFIGAAEFLINSGYTSAEKLAISGRSNGGLLVGACMTQRPDLFKVALPGVGVLDMLRYHKFTIGYAWATDYGTSEKEDEFKNLLKYSPVHNVNNTRYPATLVYTADHDDRVVPAHSYKFISALQTNQIGENPVLIRIDVNAGHGAGKPLSKTLDEWADIWAFTMENLGMNFEKGGAGK